MNSRHWLILFGTTEDLKAYFKQYAACMRTHSVLRLSNVPTAHSNMGGMRTHSVLTAVDTAASPFYVYVLQCLVRYIVDHRAESHRVCSAASVMTMYGQQSRVHSRASSHSSHVSLCHRSFQDQSAWSSRASLSLS